MAFICGMVTGLDGEGMIFELTCANARWALMHRFLSVCGKNAWILIHISETVWPRVTKFGKGMEVDDPKIYPEGQGQGLKVKVTKS